MSLHQATARKMPVEEIMENSAQQKAHIYHQLKEIYSSLYASGVCFASQKSP